MKPTRAGCRGLISAVSLLALAGPIPAGATEQIPDLIVIDGRQYSLYVNPLEAYFSRHPEKRPQSNVRSTGNWRGYVAHFEVIGTEMVLTDVRVDEWSDKERSVLKDLFPGANPLVATWFTGYLIVPDGEGDPPVPMGYGSELTRYIVIRVMRGSIAKTTRMDHATFAEFRRAQFAAFKLTAEYRNAAAEAQTGNDPMDPAMTERFLYLFFSAKYLSQVFE